MCAVASFAVVAGLCIAAQLAAAVSGGIGREGAVGDGAFEVIEVAAGAVRGDGDEFHVVRVDAPSVRAGVVEFEARASEGGGAVEHGPDDAVAFFDATEVTGEGLGVACGVAGALPFPAGVRVVGDKESDGRRLGAGTDEG